MKDVHYNTKILSRFLLVSGGSFQMGDEGIYSCNPHQVNISPFYLQEAPVENGQYEMFMKSTGHRKPLFMDCEGFNQSGQIVVGVSWHDVISFCKWLNEVNAEICKKVGEPLDVVYALPSEAQWEFAARGTDGRKYPWGNGEPNSSKVRFAPHKTPSCALTYLDGKGPFGHLNMAGNVWEWCSDVWVDEYMKDGATDPINVGDCNNEEFKTMRGGCFFSSSTALESTHRSLCLSTQQHDYLGFRIAASPCNEAKANNVNSNDDNNNSSGNDFYTCTNCGGEGYFIDLVVKCSKCGIIFG
jgi:formylglycine-generating enzyme required for sulfatase activity